MQQCEITTCTLHERKTLEDCDLADLITFDRDAEDGCHLATCGEGFRQSRLDFYGHPGLHGISVMLRPLASLSKLDSGPAGKRCSDWLVADYLMLYAAPHVALCDEMRQILKQTWKDEMEM
jgi:hypothetical protein